MIKLYLFGELDSAQNCRLFYSTAKNRMIANGQIPEKYNPMYIGEFETTTLPGYYRTKLVRTRPELNRICKKWGISSWRVISAINC